MSLICVGDAVDYYILNIYKFVLYINQYLHTTSQYVYMQTKLCTILLCEYRL